MAAGPSASAPQGCSASCGLHECRKRSIPASASRRATAAPIPTRRDTPVMAHRPTRHGLPRSGTHASPVLTHIAGGVREHPTVCVGRLGRGAAGRGTRLRAVARLRRRRALRRAGTAAGARRRRAQRLGQVHAGRTAGRDGAGRRRRPHRRRGLVPRLLRLGRPARRRRAHAVAGRAATSPTARPPWDARGRGGAITVSSAAPLLVVEGVGAGRRAFAPFLDALIWVQTDRARRDAARPRARRRRRRVLGRVGGPRAPVPGRRPAVGTCRSCGERAGCAA